MENIEKIEPVDIQAYIDRAHKMRAEAIRNSFAEFTQLVKGLFSRADRAMTIPRTEQL